MAMSDASPFSGIARQQARQSEEEEEEEELQHLIHARSSYHDHPSHDSDNDERNVTGKDVELGGNRRYAHSSSSDQSSTLAPSSPILSISPSSFATLDKSKETISTIVQSFSQKLPNANLWTISKIVLLAFILGAALLGSKLWSESRQRRAIERISSDNRFWTLTAKQKAKLNMPALLLRVQNDRTLDDATCQKEFPLLYPQLDNLVRYWQAKGGISKEMIDANEKGVSSVWGHVRLIVRDGQVFIRSFHEGSETRNSALVHLIYQAINSWPSAGTNGHDFPNVDIILSPGDRDMFSNAASWTVTKDINNREKIGQWLIPDFGFIGWPEAAIASFEEFRRQARIVEEQYPWPRKDARAFWRGFANVYAVRQDLLNRTTVKGHPEREAWSDVFQTNFHGSGPEYRPLVSLPDHCQHKYLIHVEGNSYSGRSRYLFSCHAVTIAHPLAWTQHFHPALNSDAESPHQNYVELPGPFFEGLELAMRDLRADEGLETPASDGKQLLQPLPRQQKQLTPEEEQEAIRRENALREAKVHQMVAKGGRKIADNVARIMRDRYLTPAATMCYTRAALVHYAQAMNTTSWGSNGPDILPGQGVAPDSSKGRPMTNLEGDIEVGVWRLLGSPNWPPESR